MKTLITIVIAAMLLVVVGCNEECRPTVSILTGSDTDASDNPIVGRIGVDAEGVGFGLELNYTGGHVERQSYGAYITAELEPTPVGTPYIGYHALLAIDDVEDQHGPILGTRIEITPRVSTVIEGQYVGQVDENDQYRLYAGLRYRL